MYCERCGTEIPGIHGICHQDIYSTHDDKRIVVNGGYHDAGDLTATGNTPGMVYALLSLADNLKRQGEDPVLYKRVLEEARWGLNWVLKTRFGDGYRSTGQLVSYWTDGIMGTADDRFGKAVNDPEWNFRVSAVEALAARVLKDSNPELANRSLAIAEEDWKYAVDGLKTARAGDWWACWHRPLSCRRDCCRRSTGQRTNWREFHSAWSRRSTFTRPPEIAATQMKL